MDVIDQCLLAAIVFELGTLSGVALVGFVLARRRIENNRASSAPAIAGDVVDEGVLDDTEGS